MNKDYTHILFILDDSFSMNFIIDEAIGGFNSFLEDQKKLEGKCRMHTILFGSSDKIKYLHKDKDINKIKEITKDDYNARSGMTALLDAIGVGIDDLGSFLRSMDEDERPAKVLVNIFTDGMENDSREYTEDKIREMIERQTNVYNWEFAFLASDINAQNLSHSIGITNTALTENSSVGMRSVYASLSNNALNYRKKGETLSVQDEYDKETKK